MATKKKKSCNVMPKTVYVIIGDDGDCYCSDKLADLAEDGFLVGVYHLVDEGTIETTNVFKSNNSIYK